LFAARNKSRVFGVAQDPDYSYSNYGERVLIAYISFQYF
jgi:hypothetical protein